MAAPEHWASGTRARRDLGRRGGTSVVAGRRQPASDAAVEWTPPGNLLHRGQTDASAQVRTEAPNLLVTMTACAVVWVRDWLRAYLGRAG